MKLTRRISITVATVAICVVAAICICAILGIFNISDNHDGCNEHTSSEWIVDKEATCTEVGSQHRECIVCGETLETKVTEALGHDIVNHSAKTPTCTEIGWNSYETCSSEGCNYTTYVEIVALGHDWAIEWTNNDEEHWHICTRDGCNAKSNEDVHSSTSNSHACEICDYIISSCADTDNNHKCDTCGKVLTDCADNNNDHVCDTCGAVLSGCGDNDKDHICDTCGERISAHSYDSVSDYTWAEDYSWCKVLVRCTYCNDEVEGKTKEISGTITSSVTQNKTCELPEITTYTATFDLSAHSDVVATIVAQTKNVETEDAGCVDADKNHYCDSCGTKLSDCNYSQGICTICGNYDTDGTEGLQYSYDNTKQSYSVTQYSGTSTEVKIPYYYSTEENGIHPVRSIGAEAFAGQNVISVVIPDSIESIEDGAFVVCQNLNNVTIGNGVTSIGSYAFLQCSSLSSIIIGNSVKSIGDAAFNGCTGLALVSIDVENIGTQAFYGCTSLQNVTLGSNVKSIGEGAFLNCSGLLSIVIPDTVTSVGSSAFLSCTSLTNATIGAGITSIPGAMFVSCQNLESVTINGNITSIGSGAFNGCSSLASITLPDSVTSIEGSAFSGCTNLQSVIGGNNVTSVGAYAFKDTAWLANQAGVAYVGTVACGYSGTGTAVEIKSGTESIAVSAFEKCYDITSISIPSSVKKIGQQAFYDCKNITSVYIEDVSAWSGIEFGTDYANPLIPKTTTRNLYLNGELISGAISITGVKAIGTYAFYSCSELTSVTIGDSVESIESCAFLKCTGLTNVTIGKGVTNIGSSAFNGCTDLTSLTYDGTMVEWNAITKDSTWKKDSGITSVVCIDGTITL